MIVSILTQFFIIMSTVFLWKFIFPQKTSIFWKTFETGRGRNITNITILFLAIIVEYLIELFGIKIDTVFNISHGFVFYISLILSVFIMGEIFLSKIQKHLDYSELRPFMLLPFLVLLLTMPSGYHNQDVKHLSNHIETVPNIVVKTEKENPLKHNINNGDIYFSNSNFSDGNFSSNGVIIGEAVVQDSVKVGDILSKSPENFHGDNVIIMSIPNFGLNSESSKKEANEKNQIRAKMFPLGVFDSYYMKVTSINGDNIHVDLYGYGDRFCEDCVYKSIITQEQLNSLKEHNMTIIKSEDNSKKQDDTKNVEVKEKKDGIIKKVVIPMVIKGVSDGLINGNKTDSSKLTDKDINDSIKALSDSLTQKNTNLSLPETVHIK